MGISSLHLHFESELQRVISLIDWHGNLLSYPWLMEHFAHSVTFRRNVNIKSPSFFSLQKLLLIELDFLQLMALTASMLSWHETGNTDGLFVIPKGGFEFPADVLVINFFTSLLEWLRVFKGMLSSASVGQFLEFRVMSLYVMSLQEYLHYHMHYNCFYCRFWCLMEFCDNVGYKMTYITYYEPHFK